MAGILKTSYVPLTAGRWSTRRSWQCYSSATRARRTTRSRLAKRPRIGRGNPSKNRQKDKDARWTKKHGKSFFGYKNHVNADARHKLIRDYDATDASVHDSQKLDGLLNLQYIGGTCTPTAPAGWAETEVKLDKHGL